MSAQVVTLRPAKKTYSAKPFKVFGSGLEFHMSGTLDGFIDFAIIEADGKSRTYIITPVDARLLAVNLAATADDVDKNCLYDNDALLMKDGE